MPEVYHCPSDVKEEATSYVMLGEPCSGKVTPTLCINGGEGTLPLNSIYIAEVVGSGIPWTEPRDVAIEEISSHINDPHASCIGSRHPGGANVLLRNWNIEFLHE
jgi:hypothetical protein